MAAGVTIGDRMSKMGVVKAGPMAIPVEALNKHVCILGTTGSGKSTTAFLLADEVERHSIPLLILDRTGEYVRTLGKRGASVFTPGENLVTALFQRDASIPLADQIEDWADLLNHFTSVTYHASLSPLQCRVLREVLSRYYAGTQDTLTVTRLIAKLRSYEDETRDRNGWEESVEAIISRMMPLTVGQVANTLDRPFTTLKVEETLEPGATVIDLSVLGTDGARNLLSQLVLKQLYERVRSMEETPGNRIVVLVDEAQHLAPNDPYYPSLPEKCAIELRKYGFGLVMMATRPSLISSNVIANCGTIISHMLNNERDVDTVAGYMLGADPMLKKLIRKLPVGYAVVQLNHPVPSPAALCHVGTDEQRREFGLPYSFWDPMSSDGYSTFRKSPSAEASLRL
jgi:type IV secretory pathway VirB4 component